MSQAEKQAQIDFMAGQALAIEIQQLMVGKSIATIGNALELTTGMFCLTCGKDPVSMLEAIGNVAQYHMRNVNFDPPAKTEVN